MEIRPIAFVGVEELRRGEGAHDPAREQPHAGDDEGAAGDEEGDDGGVGAPGLVVVADRVGERRPGELEAADEDVDRLRELDRQRVEAGLGEPGGADDDHPVDEVEQVERDLGRHRRQAEAQQAPQQLAVEAQREAAALRADQSRARRRRRSRSCRAAARGRPRRRRRRGRRSAPIVSRTLRIVVTKKARARSSSRNRVSMYSNIVSTQRPPIEIRARSVARVRSSSASEIGVGERQRDQGADRREPEEAGEGAGDDRARGPRRPCSRSAAAPRSGRAGRRCWRRRRPANITSAAP